jgi:hypothetical protein
MQAAFGRFIRPGSQIIESNDPNTLAALVPRTGNLVIIVRNGGTSSISYTFDLSKVTRLPAGVHVYQYLVSAYQTLSKLPDAAISNKQFTITAPAQSITTCAVPNVVDSTVTATRPSPSPSRRIALAFNCNNLRGLLIRLPSAGIYSLVAYSSSGRKVAAVNREGVAGVNIVEGNALRLPQGVYFVQIRQKENQASGTIMVIK